MNSPTNSACESLPAKATDPDFQAAQRAPGSAAHIPSDHRNVHARAFAGPNVLFAKSGCSCGSGQFLEACAFHFFIQRSKRGSIISPGEQKKWM
jgi:hypothetical protein